MLKLEPHQKEVPLFHVIPHFTGREIEKVKFDDFFPHMVGAGWVPLLEDLCVKLFKLGWDGGIWQVKEKFGTLRFYWRNNIADPLLADIAEDVVENCEARTGWTCETCGEVGRRNSDGWTLTLCDPCAFKEGRALPEASLDYLVSSGRITPEQRAEAREAADEWCRKTKLTEMELLEARAEVEQWKRNVDLTGAELRDALAEVSRLEGLILDWRDGNALWLEAERIRAQREERPELWRCENCGEEFDSPRISHGRAEHAPGCDGSCRSCPVEVECGPITAQHEGPK